MVVCTERKLPSNQTISSSVLTDPRNPDVVLCQHHKSCNVFVLFERKLELQIYISKTKYKRLLCIGLKVRLKRTLFLQPPVYAWRQCYAFRQ